MNDETFEKIAVMDAAATRVFGDTQGFCFMTQGSNGSDGVALPPRRGRRVLLVTLVAPKDKITCISGIRIDVMSRHRTISEEFRFFLSQPGHADSVMFAGNANGPCFMQSFTHAPLTYNPGSTIKLEFINKDIPCRETEGWLDKPRVVGIISGYFRSCPQSKGVYMAMNNPTSRPIGGYVDADETAESLALRHKCQGCGAVPEVETLPDRLHVKCCGWLNTRMIPINSRYPVTAWWCPSCSTHLGGLVELSDWIIRSRGDQPEGAQTVLSPKV